MRQIMESERGDLRRELQFLKDCQFKYFSLAITATGVILGISGKLAQVGDVSRQVVYLSPLIIVLPCWLIFFDKATTVTRMVAYLGLLEEMILAAPQTFYRYIGWENGVQSFRNDYRNQPWRLRFRWHLEGLRWGIARLLMFSTTQRYWIFCWYTFFGSGLLALLLGHWSGATFHSLAWLLACILFAAVALQTIKVLGSLTDGMHSFRRNADFWRSVLAGNGQKSKGKTS